MSVPPGSSQTKPAIDAVALTGALRDSRYDDEPFMLDVTRLGTRDHALAALGAYIHGNACIPTQIDPVVEIVVGHDSHGTCIPAREFIPEGAEPWESVQVPIMREGTPLMDAAQECLLIVVHAVTSETNPLALRSIISSMNSSLSYMLENVNDLPGHHLVYLVGDEPIA